LRATLPLGARQLLPSHGALVDDPERRIDELLQHHEHRLQHCLEALGNAPTTAYAVSLEVFGTGLDAFGRWLALGETLSHLEHLTHQGQVAKLEEDEQAYYLRV
jgi:hypothetical protein